VSECVSRMVTIDTTERYIERIFLVHAAFLFINALPRQFPCIVERSFTYRRRGSRDDQVCVAADRPMMAERATTCGGSAFLARGEAVTAYAQVGSPDNKKEPMHPDQLYAGSS